MLDLRALRSGTLIRIDEFEKNSHPLKSVESTAKWNYIDTRTIKISAPHCNYALSLKVTYNAASLKKNNSYCTESREARICSSQVCSLQSAEEDQHGQCWSLRDQQHKDWPALPPKIHTVQVLSVKDLLCQNVFKPLSTAARQTEWAVKRAEKAVKHRLRSRCTVTSVSEICAHPAGSMGSMDFDNLGQPHHFGAVDWIQKCSTVHNDWPIGHTEIKSSFKKKNEIQCAVPESKKMSITKFSNRTKIVPWRTRTRHETVQSLHFIKSIDLGHPTR